MEKNFNLPHEKCTVIKNGIPDIKQRDPKPKEKKLN